MDSLLGYYPGPVVEQMLRVKVMKDIINRVVNIQLRVEIKGKNRK